MRYASDKLSSAWHTVNAQIKAALMLLRSLHHHHYYLDHFAEIKMATSQLYNILQMKLSSEGANLQYVCNKRNNGKQKFLIFPSLAS